MTEVVVYSAIYGGYDQVKPVPDLGVPAVMFTDSEQTAEKAQAVGWRTVVHPHRIVTTNGDPKIVAPMLAHKWWKCHPHKAFPEADISLWVDGSIQIVRDDYVALCLQALGDDDWVAVRHPWRNCAIAEGYYSATLHWRYDHDVLHRQTDAYARFHPRDWGLIATGANVRRHSKAAIALTEAWWLECLHWSHQDQVSLPILLRLADSGSPLLPPIRWNYNMPWNEWWQLHEHGGA